MDLLAVILGIGLVKFLGSHNVLHKTQGLFASIEKLALASPGLGVNIAWTLFVMLPAAALFLLSGLFYTHSSISAGGWWLVIAVLVLVYSIGRGHFRETVQLYINANRASNWTDAVLAYKTSGGNPAAITEGDWSSLDAAMLERASYRGFERVFAVLFWFIAAGPGGAFLYRQSQLFNEYKPGDFNARWLWLMEWPAARVLGFTFAFTGNFVGCIQRWQRYMRCFKSSTEFVVTQSVLGALSINDEIAQTSTVTRRELVALQRLLDRTLWFWLGVLAVLAIGS